MKLNILYDLSLGDSAHDTPRHDADVIVRAHDAAPPGRTAHQAMRPTRAVSVVFAEPEFSGSSIDVAATGLKRLRAGTRIQRLDNDAVIVRVARAATPVQRISAQAGQQLTLNEYLAQGHPGTSIRECSAASPHPTAWESDRQERRHEHA